MRGSVAALGAGGMLVALAGWVSANPAGPGMGIGGHSVIRPAPAPLNLAPQPTLRPAAATVAPPSLRAAAAPVEASTRPLLVGAARPLGSPMLVGASVPLGSEAEEPSPPGLLAAAAPLAPATESTASSTPALLAAAAPLAPAEQNGMIPQPRLLAAPSPTAASPRLLAATAPLTPGLEAAPLRPVTRPLAQPGRTARAGATGSPAAVLAGIVLSLPNGRTVTADRLLEVQQRIWYREGGRMRRRLGALISALIAGTEPAQALDDAGLTPVQIQALLAEADS